MSAETIIGSYRIEELIGRGGMGVVFRGQHTKLPREVAIKSISPRAGAHDLRQMRHRFEREAYIQSQLDHPSIVKIYDYIVAEQTYYIVMEYVEGRSLAQLLAGEEGALPLERALYLFDQILTAVVYAHTFTYKDQDGQSHRGIIHRDLKPANILVTPHDRIKITDFGIVKLVGAETTDTFGAGYGSPRYVSPEQAEGSPVDQRSDIYSLGVILYEILTGTPPFGGGGENLSRTEILRAHVERAPRRPSELNPEVTPEVESLVLRALEKDPQRRFQTSAEFLRAVRLARARDASDIIEEAQAAAASGGFHPVGTHELDAGSDATVRQTYITQPLGETSCPACGAEADPEAERCPVCGTDLRVSDSTARLARERLARERQARSTRGKWVVAVLVALALFTGAVVLFRSSREAARRQERAEQNANAAAQPGAPPQPAPSPAGTAPPHALNELKPARVLVDSSFDGYDARPLTDGETDVRRIAQMRYNEGNWASAETPVEHWIELQFDRPVRVAAVYVYWGFDRTRFTPSRRVELQTADARGDWRTVSTVEPGENFDRTSFEFAPITSARLRLLQPAQQGPRNRSFIMWVREVKIYGADGRS